MPKFNETSPALKKFCLHTRLIKKKMGMWGSAIWREGEVCVGEIVRILWDFPCMTVLWKLLNTFGSIFGA